MVGVFEQGFQAFEELHPDDLRDADRIGQLPEGAQLGQLVRNRLPEAREAPEVVLPVDGPVGPRDVGAVLAVEDGWLGEVVEPSDPREDQRRPQVVVFPSRVGQQVFAGRAVEERRAAEEGTPGGTDTKGTVEYFTAQFGGTQKITPF